jgi:anthranilate/para-aminobenzoate synthase component II
MTPKDMEKLTQSNTIVKGSDDYKEQIGLLRTLFKELGHPFKIMTYQSQVWEQPEKDDPWTRLK